MQRTDSLDSSNGKILFKKRTHRPWNTNLLENTPEEIPAAFVKHEALSPDQLVPEMNTESKGSESLPLSISHECSSIPEMDTPLPSPSQNRVFIGGFSFPQMIYTTPNTETEDHTRYATEPSLSQSNLSVVDYNDLSKSPETQIQSIIENAKKCAEQAYKAEQHLVSEKQLRAESQKLLQNLENKVQLEQAAKLIAEQKSKEYEQKVYDLLATIEEQERLIEEATEAKRIAEEIAHTQIDQSSEVQKSIQAQLEARINQIQQDAIQKIKQVQTDADARVKVEQEVVAEYEKAKLAAQDLFQKQLAAAEQEAQAVLQRQLEITNKIELEKNELLKNLSVANKKLVDLQVEFEREIQALNDEVRSVEAKKLAVQTERELLEAQISTTQVTLRRMEGIVTHERNLRKLLDAKLSSMPSLIEEEQRRKQVENNILQHTNKISSLEAEQSRLEEKLLLANENLNKHQILIRTEKQINESLAMQIKDLNLKIHQFEEAKLQDANKDILVEQRIQELIDAQKLLEQENHQKVSELIADRQKLEHEKLNKDLEIQELMVKMQQLENLRQIEIAAKQAVEQRVSDFLNEKHCLDQEKINKDTEIKDLNAKIRHLENLNQIEIEQRQSVEQKVRILQQEQADKENEYQDLVEKIQKLEILKHAEVLNKQKVEERAAELIQEKQQLETEKTQHQEELNKMLRRTKELELMIEAEKKLRMEANSAVHRVKELELMLEEEKRLRIEAERLQLIEEQAKKAAQERISIAIAEANQTVLNALGGLTKLD